MKKYLFYFVIIFILITAIVSVLFFLKNSNKELPLPDFLKTLISPPSQNGQSVPSDNTEKAEIAFSLESSNSAEIQTNLPPVCISLSASKTSGSIPLTVGFTGSGEDQDEKISAFEFDFGDGNKNKVNQASLADKQAATAKTSYIYSKSGQFTASLKVFDNKNAESVIPNVCQVKINVTSAVGGGAVSPTIASSPTLTLAPSPTSKPAAVSSDEGVPFLPESGGFLPTLATRLGAGAIIILGILL